MPGNRVDIHWALKVAAAENRSPASEIPLLENVEILAVEKTLEAPAGTRIDAIEIKTVTVQVTPDEAGKLTLAISKGTIHLSLRNSDDHSLALAPPPPRMVPLATLIKKGMRAVSIPTPSVASSVSGFVVPGNRVDIHWTPKTATADNRSSTSDIPLLENVEILAVEEKLDAPAGNRMNGIEIKMVTVHVTSEQAGKLAMAINNGTIHLSMRTPGDDSLAIVPPPPRMIRGFHGASKKMHVIGTPGNRSKLAKRLNDRAEEQVRMRICVIADEDPLKSRIGQALAACRDHEADPAIPSTQAEAQLAAQKPELVVIAACRTPDETIAMVALIRDLTPGQVLVVGPVSDSRMVLGVLRSGAADYVDEAAVEEDLAPALQRLKAGRGTKTNPGRLIAVLAPSGGSGASMVTANLALAMARTQERSLAIDLKPRSGDLAAMFDLRPSHTLQDLCRVATRIDRVLFDQTLSKLPTGVSLLASPRSFDAILSTEAITRVFELGRGLFPRVIVDCDPALPEETIAALRSADSILLVLRLEFNSLRNAKAMIDQLERQRVDPRRISLVGNRVGQPKEIPAAKVEEALSRKFFAKLPDDPKAALGSQNSGVPVLIEYPSSRLSKALVAMASALDALPPLEGKGA